MAEQFLITRDNIKPEDKDVFGENYLVYFWDLNCTLVKDDGVYIDEDNELQGFLSLDLPMFKKVFGFIPRKGSKRILTINISVKSIR